MRLDPVMPCPYPFFQRPVIAARAAVPTVMPAHAAWTHHAWLNPSSLPRRFAASLGPQPTAPRADRHMQLRDGMETQSIAPPPPGPLRHHLPMNGYWQGERGDSAWFSNDPVVQRITHECPVHFRNGFPDFSPWAQSRLTFAAGELCGEASDMPLADVRYAANHGITPEQARDHRKQHRLVWHHCEDGRTLLLVPMDLHMHVPHTGGAALLRRAAART